MRAAPASLWEGPGGWWLAPEGGAIHPAERTAVVADVHLGYEWARAAGGDCVPAHSLAETLDRLARLLAHTKIDRLVVAGDLVESRTPCRRTDGDVARLTRWLAERDVSLVALEGNHDPPRRFGRLDTLDVAGWTISHGHRPIDAPRTIRGHHHPILRLEGLSAPCFLVGPSAIVLPAFSANAAGVNVLAEPAAIPWDGAPPRCVASSGDALLDFGPRPSVLNRLRARPPS